MNYSEQMEVAERFCLQLTDLNVNTDMQMNEQKMLYCGVAPPLEVSLPPATVLLFTLRGGESKEMHWGEQAESIVLICVVCCTVSASRENSKRNGIFAFSQKVSASLLCFFLRKPA